MILWAACFLVLHLSFSSRTQAVHMYNYTVPDELVGSFEIMTLGSSNSSGVQLPDKFSYTPLPGRRQPPIVFLFDDPPFGTLAQAMLSGGASWDALFRSSPSDTHYVIGSHARNRTLVRERARQWQSAFMTQAMLSGLSSDEFDSWNERLHFAVEPAIDWSSENDWLNATLNAKTRWGGSADVLDVFDVPFAASIARLNASLQAIGRLDAFWEFLPSPVAAVPSANMTMPLFIVDEPCRPISNDADYTGFVALVERPQACDTPLLYSRNYDATTNTSAWSVSHYMTTTNDSCVCTVFKMLDILAQANFSSVIVTNLDGPQYPLKQLSCVGRDCERLPPNIGATMISYEDGQRIRSLVRSSRSQPRNDTRRRRTDGRTRMRLDNLAEFSSGTSTLVASGLSVSFRSARRPATSIAIDQRSTAQETGYLAVASLQSLAWVAQYFDYLDSVYAVVESNTTFPPISLVPGGGSPSIEAQNNSGTYTVTVDDMPLWEDLSTSVGSVVVELRLLCNGTFDLDCPPWDRVLTLDVSCDKSPWPNSAPVELARWVNPFRRRVGHWITDVTTVKSLLATNSGSCNFTASARDPWVWNITLRFFNSSVAASVPYRVDRANVDADEGNFALGRHAAFDPEHRELVPVSLDDSRLSRSFVVVSAPPSSSHAREQRRSFVPPLGEPTGVTVLWTGVRARFNDEYNAQFPMVTFIVPNETSQVWLTSLITGHGNDANGCGEFCDHQHYYSINNQSALELSFPLAATFWGCAGAVSTGSVPNEYGTWNYGRGGWCDGQNVFPWTLNVTDQVNLSGGSNELHYFAGFNDTIPYTANTTTAYMIVSAYLSFFRGDDFDSASPQPVA